MFRTPSYRRASAQNTARHNSFPRLTDLGPKFEALEPRQLLSATFTSDDRTLWISGTDDMDLVQVANGPSDGSVVIVAAPEVEPNTLFAGVTRVIISTGGGDDRVIVGQGLKTPLGAPLGVNITTGDGNDYIEGGSGDDTIDAGLGNDRISDSLGNNLIVAGEGNNVIFTGSGNDSVSAGAGKDLITDTGGANLLAAGHGKNIVFAGAGNDTILTGLGSDKITDLGGDNLITASAGKNQIVSGQGNDTIFTSGGSDKVTDYGGNNVIAAGEGKNKVYTQGSGNDSVVTGSKNDTIFDSGGKNSLNAGGGKNKVIGDNSGVPTDTVASPDLAPLLITLEQTLVTIGVTLPQEIRDSLDSINNTLEDLLNNPNLPDAAAPVINTVIVQANQLVTNITELNTGDPAGDATALVVNVVESADSLLQQILELPVELLAAVEPTLNTLIGASMELVATIVATDPNPNDPNIPLLETLLATVEEVLDDALGGGLL